MNRIIVLIVGTATLLQISSCSGNILTAALFRCHRLNLRNSACRRLLVRRVSSRSKNTNGTDVAAARTSVGLLAGGWVLVLIFNEPVDLPSDRQMADNKLPSTRTQDAGLRNRGTPEHSCSNRKLPRTDLQLTVSHRPDRLELSQSLGTFCFLPLWLNFFKN